MTITRACVLGVVQGLTQFFPISSNAHLAFVCRFLHWQTPTVAMVACLKLGSALAILLCFGSECWRILRAGVASIVDRRVGFDHYRLLFWLILMAILPLLGLQLLVGDEVDRTFQDPVLLAIPLALGGFFLYWIDGKYAALRSFEELGPKDAFFVGLGQAFAVMPGMSRTGTAITLGRLMGINRESCARFAFLLSLPVLLTEALSKWRTLTDQVGVVVPVGPLVAAFATSAFVGIICLLILLRFVRAGDYAVFAWYRIVLAVAVILSVIYFG